RIMYWGWMITLGLISAQVLFGALVVLNGTAYGLEANITLFVALFHALFITCYFGMLSYFILLSSRSAKLKKLIQTKALIYFFFYYFNFKLLNLKNKSKQKL